VATLELDDIQGIIRRGYGDMYHACFVLLEITDAGAAKRWLRELAGAITDGENKPPEGRLNIAFTCAGLERLGLDGKVIRGFSQAFREGMVTEERQRILSDYGNSAPETWDWGGPNNPQQVHVLLLLYAPSQEKLDEFYRAQRTAFEAGRLSHIRRLDTIRLKERKEHFGFRDGIAQPEIAGLDKGGAPGNIVATGEFLLGYKNEAGRYPDSPGEFGRNGSYLVFRQLRQHVGEFWQFMEKVTQRPDGSSSAEAQVKVASKMVGRWPSGAPLVNHPNQDPDKGKEEKELPSDDLNDRFGYHEADPHGYKCPPGSHIRRSNPRDALEPGPRVVSAKNSNLHRIVRRGRAYGAPIAASMEPADILNAGEPEGERGLHFLCFNADIARQFEFVRQNWVNSPKFEGLFYNASDPITGVQDPRHKEYTDTFTIPAMPIRQRVTGLKQFVDVRGGAYFFMPGIQAIKYLASLP
jgi:Dyp-type peroxidase family